MKLASEFLLSMKKFETLLPHEESYPSRNELDATTLLKSL